MQHRLPDLPCATKGLEPFMSPETLDFITENIIGLMWISSRNWSAELSTNAKP
jgi:hypothetical protein